MKTVLIVIPVYNEEFLIYGSINKLRDFCEKNLQNYDWKIIIGDNNSIDGTAGMAKKIGKRIQWKNHLQIHPSKRQRFGYPRKLEKF